MRTDVQLWQAAAAMVVGVGSLSDPPNMQGLSHYLEHMLFMGSEQFPDENDYDSFLSKNGGGSNAYTELVRLARPLPSRECKACAVLANSSCCSPLKPDGQLVIECPAYATWGA